jgi:hypothetical protein
MCHLNRLLGRERKFVIIPMTGARSTAVTFEFLFIRIEIWSFMVVNIF